MSRSNIKLVGNTTQGQNLGDGAEVFKTKAGGNLLQFRSIAPTGDSIQIYEVDDKILISGASGGGTSYGSNNQVPFMNGAGDDFEYSNNLIWNDTCFLVKNDGVAFVRTEGNGTGDVGLLMNQGGSVSHTITQCSTMDDWLIICNGGTGSATTWITTGDGNGSVVIGNLSQSGTWFSVRDRNSSAHACTFSVANTGGSTAFNVRCDGLVYMPELPAKSTETNVVYIDSSGKLSCGAGGGGTPTGTACTLATYDASGNLSELPICTNLTTGSLCNCSDNVWEIKANCGNSGSQGGKGLTICAGNNFASGTNGAGDLRLFAGSNVTGGAVSGGQVYISPGVQATTSAVGQIVIGNSSYTSSEIALSACGSQPNVNLTICSKGDGNINLGTNSGYVYMNTSCLSISNAAILSTGACIKMWSSYVTGCILGGTGVNTNGRDLLICGGCAYTSSGGNHDGGNVILCAGSPVGTGSDGRIVLSGLPSQSTETCVVYIDASGNLSTGTPSSDSRLKCCVKPLSCAVSYLENICGYSAEFNNLSNCEGCCEYVFIAQEVETILPLAVKNGVIINDVDYKKVEYNQLVPVLWNIVKELEARIQVLESQ